MQKVHFIAIGGSAMHNLALSLHKKGYFITGSDDEIFEPSYSRLNQKGILPQKTGWDSGNIHPNLDAVILGMHAKIDNPELIKAQQLGLKIYSYPEYIYEQSKDKQRIVIAGSHGKTTTTSMILHVLKYCGKNFDYLVGAQLEGFENMVKLSDAPVIIIEGDEYLDSATNRIPKFLFYKHHTTLITGIAWDHINVFPTFEDYKKQFEILIDSTPKSGVIIYNEDDKTLATICKNIKREDVLKVEYSAHKSKVKDGKSSLITKHDLKVSVPFFGDHNMYNVQGAFEVCCRLGVLESEFYDAISTFKGASNRLELLTENGESKIFKDFAHAPSKLDATTKAVRKQFPKHKFIACLELHTFSSLNIDFINQYKSTFNSPDVAIVYYNPITVEHKKLKPIQASDIIKGFDNKKLIVFDDSIKLQTYLLEQNLDKSIVLLMSSGNFDGIILKDFANKLLKG